MLVTLQPPRHLSTINRHDMHSLESRMSIFDPQAIRLTSRFLSPERAA